MQRRKEPAKKLCIPLRTIPFSLIHNIAALYVPLPNKRTLSTPDLNLGWVCV
jgi:hypothetical protein